MGDFIVHEEGVLKTICHIYKNKDGKTLQLLPVTHIGEKGYYKDLMNYIGDKTCLYEGIDITFGEITEDELEYSKKFKGLEQSAENVTLNPKTLDERIALIGLFTDMLQKDARKDIKKYNSLVITGELRKLRKEIKRNLRRVDERVSKAFYLCEQNGFRLFNLEILHNLVAQTLGLYYQYNVIDCILDIPKRKNWIHADMTINMAGDLQNAEEEDQDEENTEDVEDSEQEIPKYDPFDVENSKQNALVMYSMLFLVIHYLLDFTKDQRLENFAQSLVDNQDNAELLKRSAPGYTIESRNRLVMKKTLSLLEEINEIVIFYGALHMDDFERTIQNKGFELNSTSEFIVYRYKVQEKENK